MTLVIPFVILAMAFSACSNADGDSTVTASGEVPTEEAVIKEIDAIHFIEQCYTEEELGLDKVEDDYKMMVASNGVDIDGKKYVKVVANVVVRNDTTNEEGKETFSMETVGEYFISFDAKTVLMKDRENRKYKKLENRYDEYVQNNVTSSSQTTAVTQSTAHSH